MLILASSSPWRATLLKQAGFTFKVVPTDIDETTDMRSMQCPQQLVKTLALKKAQACQNSLSSATILADSLTILAADTIVWANNQIIGKPIDRQDAHRIISLLSGNTHQVWTGVCILRPKPQRLNRLPAEKTSEVDVLFAEKSEVTFRRLTSQEIEDYLDTNDWVGKAGAYQLQLNINKYVTNTTGDKTNIIGLPLSTTTRILHQEFEITPQIELESLPQL